MIKKHYFYDFTLESCKAWMNNQGFPTYLAPQLFDWVYKKHITNLDQMTNISKSNRHKLNSLLQLDPFSKVESITSKAELAIKNLCYLHDDKIVECVILKEKTLPAGNEFQ